MTFDFGMTFDFSVDIGDEHIVIVGEFDGVSLWMAFPVAVINLAPPFSGMAKATLFSQFPEQFLVQVVKGFFSRTGFVVVGPTPDDGIELANKSRLTMASILSDDLFEVV